MSIQQAVTWTKTNNNPREWSCTLACGHKLGADGSKPLNDGQKAIVEANGWNCLRCDAETAP